ncbi:DUF928 domain-containing protein [Pseudanabaena yagii]|uniref:DUF928 domain-containing protein n=1 Tax=Pseudanabaena yagii GIHE-NHR1 TaxID=2722753 RepID=A0ABX1LQX3_9CYAN|nr:DUF928 domain-containing protein [Pseudanabaena yagii]NMF57748.1 DUF928 domain-containing protein [Pseudanabaena yagii GIHE-NHR1]
MILTRIATKNSNIKAITLSAICLGTVCLTSVASSLSFVPEAFAQYGLGLPKSSGVGGATRSPENPTIILLVPKDGAKTLSARPTFFLSINPPEVKPEQSTTATSTKKISERKNTPITFTFLLRDGNESSSKPIFTTEVKADKFGLYKFTLPENAPALAKKKEQRWQIRYNNGASNTYAVIRLESDDNVTKAIASAKSDLEKARIYAKNFYWYDAIEAYDSWLSKKPKDDKAILERSQLFKAGLEKHLAFITVKTDARGNTIKDQQGVAIEEFRQTEYDQFLNKLDKSIATSIALEPKKFN